MVTCYSLMPVVDYNEQLLSYKDSGCKDVEPAYKSEGHPFESRQEESFFLPLVSRFYSPL